MMNRINLVCLGVKNLDRSLDFYTSLGFKTSVQHGAAIVFFDNQGSKLELYPIDLLAQDISSDNPPTIDQTGFSGITLACNMKSTQEVDKLFALVKELGGTIIKEPKITEWGGYSGYFQDPDNYYWEVAYGESWQFDSNDMLVID